MDLGLLPPLNAVLNGLSAAAILIGHWQIRRGNRAIHKKMMITAFGISCLFIVSYIYLHSNVGVVKFRGTGFIRSAYFVILGTHSVLAAAVVPMVLLALTRGLRDQTEKHKRIARWAYPVWLYVSVTGVIVYLMLYHLPV